MTVLFCIFGQINAGLSIIHLFQKHKNSNGPNFWLVLYVPFSKIIFFLMKMLLLLLLFCCLFNLITIPEYHFSKCFYHFFMILWYYVLHCYPKYDIYTQIKWNRKTLHKIVMCNPNHQPNLEHTRSFIWTITNVYSVFALNLRWIQTSLLLLLQLFC